MEFIAHKPNHMNPANITDIKKVRRDPDPNEITHDQKKVERVFKDASMNRRILSSAANPRQRSKWNQTSA